MRQLRALVGLRWQMVRDRRIRVGLALLALSLPALVVTVGVAGQLAPEKAFAFNVLLLAPSLFLGFAALSIAGPLSSGGGNELYPHEQLVAFPVRPSTVYLATLAAAPLNLAWAIQVVSLAAATSFVSDRGPLVLLSEITTLLYVVSATVIGQSLAWAVVGLRQTRAGRLLTLVLGLSLIGGLAVVVAAHSGTALLDRAPTTGIVLTAIQVSQGHWGPWAVTAVAMALVSAAAVALGVRACAWATRQPNDSNRVQEARRQTRRAPATSVLTALLRTDRASVWRSAPLRRGLFLLAILPGVVAAGVRVPWPSLPLLPGLVAAGAGLLFGVNAFCLDGSGSLWLASLPHAPARALLSKAAVTAEACLVAVLLAIGTATVRAPATPTAAELTALVGSIVSCTAIVVASCMRLSVERPHRADLRGPRDAPAPPATMAVYSLRLALSTTTLGLLFSAAAVSGLWPVSVVLAGFALGGAVMSLRSTGMSWRDEAIRARVVFVVSSG